MPWIASATASQLRQRIDDSNRSASEKRTQYPKWEYEAIRACYTFIPCPCDEECFCRQHGCDGHWVINANLSFQQFLNHYANLWTPYRNSLKNAVLYDSEPHPRNKGAIPLLQQLKTIWLDENMLFPEKVAKQRKCMVCDSPLDPKFRDFIDTARHLYESKAFSQLFYDIIVPYDTHSRQAMMKMGYSDPRRSLIRTNDQLRVDVRAFIVNNRLTVPEFRGLDDPRIYFPRIPERASGQPFSRVVDKLFYRP